MNRSLTGYRARRSIAYLTWNGIAQTDHELYWITFVSDGSFGYNDIVRIMLEILVAAYILHIND